MYPQFTQKLHTLRLLKCARHMRRDQDPLLSRSHSLSPSLGWPKSFLWLWILCAYECECESEFATTCAFYRKLQLQFTFCFPLLEKTFFMKHNIFSAPPKTLLRSFAGASFYQYSGNRISPSMEKDSFIWCKHTNWRIVSACLTSKL